MTRHDRVYHGLQIDPEDETQQWAPATIHVETPKSDGHHGLYQLPLPDRHGDFAWGYDGTGPSRVAIALLTDALTLGDPKESGIGITSIKDDPVMPLLREDFVLDFLEEACDEWRMSRPMILRWVRSWYLQRGVDDLPTAVQRLPELQAD